MFGMYAYVIIFLFRFTSHFAFYERYNCSCVVSFSFAPLLHHIKSILSATGYPFQDISREAMLWMTRRIFKTSLPHIHSATGRIMRKSIQQTGTMYQDRKGQKTTKWNILNLQDPSSCSKALHSSTEGVATFPSGCRKASEAADSTMTDQH
jgi:hypothetical protein